VGGKEMMNKRALLVFGLFGLAMIIALAVFANQQAKTPDDESYSYTDSDTGEVISVKPGVADEKFGTTGSQATVIGLSSLGAFGSISLNQNQLPIFRENLLQQGLEALGTHDSIVKVVNPALNSDTLFIEADLIYKKDVKPARLVFDIKDEFEFRYEVWVNASKVYESGALFTTNVGAVPPESH
jgi:hypothetical protein